jgi:hypothetical protein
MIYDYPTVIVDSFFKDPQAIKELGLSMDFQASKTDRFSGKRTESLHIKYPGLFKEICNKILKCYSLEYINYNASLHFHVTGEQFGDSGWCHVDSITNNPGIASIIFLNQDDGSSGTSTYRLKNVGYDPNDQDYWNTIRKTFYNQEENPEIELLKKEHKSNFQETVNISSVYNRMISFDKRCLHAGNGYYGNSVENMRLVMLAFFYEIELKNKISPLHEAEILTYI